MIAGRSILFIADYPPPFTGQTFRTVGVGGTPALIVLIAEEMARRGARVVVATAGDPGAADGPVRYVASSTLAHDPFDLVILTKRWSDLAARVDASLRVLFVTDVHVNPDAQLERAIAWAHACFAGSAFKPVSVVDVLGADRVEPLGWPVDVDAYADAPAARDNVIVYCSVPDRGLYYLKDIFPAVRRAVPDARLVITSDFSLWRMTAAREAFERFFRGQPGIEYLGHVDRPTLIAAQARAKVMAYPCTFPEGFCLSAAECMAAGTVPVTTAAFALTTTVGSQGVLIAGRPRSPLYRRRFTKAVVRLLTDASEWQMRSRACRQRAAAEFHPSRVVDRLLDRLERVNAAVRA